MAIQVLVGGFDRTVFYTSGSLRWEDQLEGRGTLSIQFFDDVGGFRPRDGQELLVVQDGQIRFGGILLEPEEYATPAADMLFFDCTAVEYSSLCDRFTVARAYTAQTLGDIVRDIIAQDMPDEGIDVSGVEDGPVIEKAVFNWRSVTEAFNELAELSGMTWRIDQYKVLRYHSRASYLAPQPLTMVSVQNGSLRIRGDRQQYRNRQVLRAGVGLTEPRTEVFVGDGARSTFTSAFKMGTEPIVTVNGVAQTVGIRQVESGKDWYWNKGANELSQDSSGTVLTDSDTLQFTYQGMFPILVSVDREAEILARKGIEGGSGRYTQVEERPNIETVDAAMAAAQSLLNRYGQISVSLQCTTDQPGYEPGQLVRATFPHHNVDDDYLIESVTAMVPPGMDEIWYGLKCISGDPYGGWQEYFRRILQIGRTYVINENEVVIGLVEFDDAVGVSDAMTVTTGYPEFRVGAARVGFSVVRAA